jgi:hypothetical protein
MRGLTNCVQVERAGQALQLMVIFAHRRARLKPGGLGSGPAWALVDLDEVNHAAPIVSWLKLVLPQPAGHLGAHQVEKEHQVDHAREQPLRLAEAKKAVAPEAQGAEDRR